MFFTFKLLVDDRRDRFPVAAVAAPDLRGRVGRGAAQSHCVLVYKPPLSSAAKTRLAVLRDTNDGFVVAQRDLELRGPGELFGTRQAGVPRLRFASFSGEGMKMLVAAREALGKEVGADDVNIEVVVGHPGRTITDYADENGIDCIVIASHQPGLQDYFLGSTAARVVRHAHCAVHVLR